MNDPFKFGELLAAHLEEQERADNWLAKKIGVHRSTVSRWLNGGTHPDDPRKIEDISRYLHLSQEETNALLASCNFSPLQNAQEVPMQKLDWALSFESPSFVIRALAVYNGKLYASGQDDIQSNGRLYCYDASNWTDTHFSSQVGVVVDFVESLQVFNDRLYIGTRIDFAGRKFARVYYTYDGIHFFLDLSREGQVGFSGIEDLTIHNNTLYAANGCELSEVYQRNDDDNWTMLGSAIELGSPVRTLASHNGNLFAGTGAWGKHPKLWQWADSEWKLVKNLRSGEWYLTQDSVWSLASYNSKLYVGLMGQGNSSPIFAYDGTNWTIDKKIPGCNYAKLTLIDNKLWVGTDKGRVFYLGKSGWEEKPIKEPGPDAVMALAQYGEFVYAGTFGDGRIYRLRLKGASRE